MEALQPPAEQDLLTATESEEEPDSTDLTEELDQAELDALFAATKNEGDHSENEPRWAPHWGTVRGRASTSSPIPASSFVADTASLVASALHGNSLVDSLSAEVLDELLDPLLNDGTPQQPVVSRTPIRFPDGSAADSSTAEPPQNGSGSAALPAPRPHGLIMPFSPAPASASNAAGGTSGPAITGASITADAPVSLSQPPAGTAQERHGSVQGEKVGTASSKAGSGSGSPPPSVTITADIGANEFPTSPGQFTIHRDDSGESEDLTVHFVVGGTATEGVDYGTIGTTRTIRAGEPTSTIFINPIDDDIAEGIESVIIKVLPDQDGLDYIRSSPAISDRIGIIDDECSGGGSGGPCPGPGLELELAEVHSQRTAGGPSENLFQIQSDEHFEIGSTFQFQLVAAHGDTSNIRWELWEQDPLNPDDLLASGSGTSFSYAFGSNHDGADPYVRFYDDADGDGSQGGGEAYVDSPVFYVQEKWTYSIKVDVSSAIPSPPNASTVQSLLDGAEGVLLSKDSDYDYRSAVDFVASQVTTFTATSPGGARPDPVLNQQAEKDKHFDAPADIVFVNDITETDVAGYTDNFDWHRIIVEYSGHSAAVLHVVIAHEMGHGVGLDHPGHEPYHIMDVTAYPFDVHQTKSDADTYD